MVNSNPDRARVAAALNRFTQRTIIRTERGGRVTLISPSQRDISRRTGIPRSTLGDFLRDPESVSARTFARMQTLLSDERLQLTYRGERVAYTDAPEWTRPTLRNMRIPEGATGFRFVTRTDEATYQGYRSTEWLGDVDRIDELAEAVPGGLEAIERIVFDVGE